jgi:HAD superfamily hydrolase (TIGR01484 family)
LCDDSIPGTPSNRPNLHDSLRPKTAEAFQVGTELSFYQDYSWTLYPFPTVEETVGHLNDEIAKLGTAREAWHVREVMTNIFLLSCAVLNSIDDYVHGPTYRVPKKALKLPFAHVFQMALTVAEKSTAILRWFRVAQAKQWKQQWQVGFDVFLQHFVGRDLPRSDVLARMVHQLPPLLRRPLPTDLRAKHIRIASAFRGRDLTPYDILALGRKFVSHFPDRQQPILVIGLRTAGSYFASLLCPFLQSEGYRVVDMVTVRPKNGLAAWECAELTRCARARYLVVVVDEPPFSGNTIGLSLEQIRKAGFQSDKLVIMFPLRPMNGGSRNQVEAWRNQVVATGFVNKTVISLEPEEWYKHHVLTSEVVEGRLREYFLQSKYTNVTIVASPEADEFNAQLQDWSDISDRHRIKRIFAVRLETRDGQLETRFVLAKGVGWGVFGYSAFLAGWQLAGFVPPLLGLRDGILYTEWLPQAKIADACTLDRSHWIERAAEYVAARVVSLGLETDPTPSLGFDSQQEGLRMLGITLCKAYGFAVTAKLMESRFRRKLSRRTCPYSILIDGKMSLSEWIVGPSGLLKTDFEHHGFGKEEINVTDPAYDLADAVLQLGLSPIEEQELIRCYVLKTGDTRVKDRLFYNKLLAGIWSMAQSLDNLLKQTQPSSHRAPVLNEQYVRAWDFLTRECTRFCGDLCHRPQSPHWHSPLVVLDVDGVLDRRIFGFPTTTVAGIRALRYLHAHGHAVAINTARSVREVEEYCGAYGFVGGVAEYGSYVFDAVANHGKVLASAEALEQLEELRRALRQIPGVFLNEGYKYSIRAYIYESNGMVPLPNQMVPNIINRLNLDRLRSHQTTIDTTIVANEVDKGRGLNALLAFVGHPDADTVAVGDSEHDLAMFRVANRSFAPGKIGRPDLVKAVGGQIARDPAQRGLLEIARFLIHPDGSRCRSCPSLEIDRSEQDDLFLDLLETADKKRSILLLRALLQPRAFQVFVQS